MNDLFYSERARGVSRRGSDGPAVTTAITVRARTGKSGAARQKRDATNMMRPAAKAIPRNIRARMTRATTIALKVSKRSPRAVGRKSREHVTRPHQAEDEA
jgi:hypothetical protein